MSVEIAGFFGSRRSTKNDGSGGNRPARSPGLVNSATPPVRLQHLSALAQPFWNNRTFIVKPQSRKPTLRSCPYRILGTCSGRCGCGPETATVSGRMTAALIALLASLRTTIRSRSELGAEILALRHQLGVLQRTTSTRPRLRPIDRLLWVVLPTVWPNWRQAMQIVTPATVVRWHRHAFAAYWRWDSRPRRVGRPALAADIRALIRQMHQANPLWGAPRIHGELQKLGIAVAQTTVAKYLGRPGDRPSQSWRTFLANHVSQLASIDFFTVPTATFRVLFVFVVLSHDRRRLVHVNVTAHPTAAWTAQQLREAWPWDTAPRFVIRDRDRIYGADCRRTAQQMGIEEVLTTPCSPWQNPFVERVIGSIRRECLDHVIVWNERSLDCHLRRYLAYYHEWRTHLALDKDAPVPRAAQPPACGTVVSVPHIGGLHHHYERRAA
jgi:putative transposase